MIHSPITSGREPTTKDKLDLALKEHQSGQRREAERLYRQILAEDPAQVDALHLLGLIAHQDGDDAAAVEHILRALRLNPDFAEAHNNLGVIQYKQGRLDEAAASHRRALRCRPDYADAHANLGNVLRDQGQLDEAAACFRQAIQQSGADCHFAAHNSLGTVLHKQARPEEAAASYRQALRLKPNHVETHINLGIALKELGRLDDAVASLRRALQLQPDSAEAHNNLGNALREQGKRAEATEAYRQSLRLKPQVAEVHDNLGIVLMEQGKLDVAEEAFRQALQLRPDYPEAHKNLGINALLGGNLGAGWPEYEWRWQCKDRTPRKFEIRNSKFEITECPLWDGSRLDGRVILLHAEQGFGDTLQFIRYAPLVKERGGQVLVECAAALVPLLSSCSGIDRLIPHGEAPLTCSDAAIDVQAPLMTLPRLLGTNTVNDIPAQVPYIAPPADRVEHWRRRLASVPGFRVGIAWQGNPQHRGDRWRSVPLSTLAPLAELDGVSLVSLQKGFGVEQLAEFAGRRPVVDFGQDLDADGAAFLDTAAIMKNLDLVVTIDTALAHLAGALAVPTCVSLSINADWRWFLGRDDSPWYPSLKLFRQTRPKEWDDVFHRIAGHIHEKAAARWTNCQSVLHGGTDCLPALQEADAHNDQGLALAEQSKLDEAIVEYQRALCLRPDFHQAHNNLGLALQKQGKLDMAADSLRRAVAIRPEGAEALSNLGNVLKELGKLEEAAASYRQALRLKPDFVGAHVNLGVLCVRQGRRQEAAACYEQAMRLDADSVDAHWNRSLLWLQQGDFERGWPEYEWRWRRAEQQPRPFTQPHWDGQPLAGRTILLHAEQGLGDALQFVRFVPLVEQKGGKVLLECRRALVRLFSGMPGVDRVIGRGEPLPAFDVHAPLLSLPRLLGICCSKLDIHNSARIPYLQVSDDLTRHWRARLEERRGEGGKGRGGEGEKGSLRVGIAWQGNPKHGNDRCRSVPLHMFAPLADLPGINLISLQKGPGSEQLLQTPGLVDLDLGAELTDFADTAAVLRNLDLVVTVDSALAHLAGALGVTDWVALPFASDWRWLLDCDDSPWYPSLRLFRQIRFQDWDEVFHRIADAMPKREGERGKKGEGEKGRGGEAERRMAAQRMFEAGNFLEAESVLRQILPADAGRIANPSYGETLNLLAVVLDTKAIHFLNDGKLDEAAGCFREALRCQPSLAATHNNLGVVLQKQGKEDEAADAFRQALRFQRDFIDAAINLGNILRNLDKKDEALACFQELVRTRPDHAGAHFNLGRVLKDLGRLDEALACFRQAAQQNPGHVDAHSQLGHLLKEQGKLTDALAHFEQAVRLNPSDAEVHNNLGIALLDLAKPAEAEASFRQALSLRPNFANVHSNLGIALMEVGKLDEAIASCRHAMALKPGYDKAYNNLGLVLQKQGKLEEAAASYREALRLQPGFADARNNLGNVLRGLGMLKEARASYDEALRLKPDFSARWNLSLLWLLEGDFERGFVEYECRWQRPGSPPRDFPQPLWQGEPLENRRILLHAEQGLGDTIHFVRYAALVKKLGGTVILECQAALQRLLSRCPEFEQVLAHGDALPPFDVHAPLLSLPRIMGTHTFAQIPATVPYLDPAPELVERWRARLEERMGEGETARQGDRETGSLPLSVSPLLPLSHSSLRVGICWQGNPRHTNDRCRSVPLERFAQLAGVPGVSLVSLQKDLGSEQLVRRIANPSYSGNAANPSYGPTVDLGSELTDMADTAGAVKCLDLVVTVDTSVAHLAGALGVPVWVALPFAPDWRWLLDRPDSPWYPTMRLFRQTERDNWDDVFERIRCELPLARRASEEDLRRPSLARRANT